MAKFFAAFATQFIIFLMYEGESQSGGEGVGGRQLYSSIVTLLQKRSRNTTKFDFVLNIYPMYFGFFFVNFRSIQNVTNKLAGVGGHEAEMDFPKMPANLNRCF
jgi:hypothetical protein